MNSRVTCGVMQCALQRYTQYHWFSPLINLKNNSKFIFFFFDGLRIIFTSDEFRMQPGGEGGCDRSIAMSSPSTRRFVMLFKLRVWKCNLPSYWSELYNIHLSLPRAEKIHPARKKIPQFADLQGLKQILPSIKFTISSSRPKFPEINLTSFFVMTSFQIL